MRATPGQGSQIGQLATRLVEQYPNGAALAGYGALAILFYAPLLLGLRTFPDGDFTHHFLPFTIFQLEALRSGQLPVWNPYTYAGHPFLADPQAAVFYPLSNLLLILTARWSDAGVRLYVLQLEAVIQVALAGFFLYLLVAGLVKERWAAFTAGCTFAFSGYLTGYPPLQLAILRTAIWLPLLLWLLHCAFAQPTQWRWWIGAGLVGATAVFAGHPQTLLYLGYGVGAYCVLRVAYLVGHEPRRRVAAVAGVLGFILLALGLSAAQLWPSLEFTGLSVRANVDYAFVSGGLPPQDSWQILLPGVLTQFSPLYVGVIGLGLAGLSVGAWNGRIGHRPSLIFFAGLALVGLLLAYGDNSFLYPIFYRLAPGWGLFRGQERAALWVTLGLSVLVGYGAAAIPTLALPIRQRLALIYLLVVAAGVYSFGLLWQLGGHSAISPARYLLIAFVTLALAAALVVLLRLPGWSRRRAVWVTVLALLNLLWANGGTNLDRFGPLRKTILAPEVAAIEQAVGEQADTNLGLPGRTYNEFRVYEDYGMRSHLEDVWGSSPLRLARYARLFDNFPLDRLWRLTGVEHLLTWRRELFEPSTLLAEFPQTTDATYLHRLREPNPRAWLTSQVQPVDDDDAVRLLADHSFDLERIALMPVDTLAEPTSGEATGPYELRLERLALNRLRVNVTSEHGGLVVISENWLPGWHVRNATCNGETSACSLAPTPLAGLTTFQPYRTDLTLVGVVIPAGAVQFELRYWPASVGNGLWISVGSAALLLVALGWRRWGRGL